MVTIELFDHPFSAEGPKKFTAASVAEWLLGYYGDTTKFVLQVFRGQPSRDHDITNDLPAMLEDTGSFTVLQSPGAFVPAVAWWIIGGLAVGIAGAIYARRMTQGLPANVNRTQESPNNSLGGRQNKARLLERIEDIYGTVRAVPSLLQPVYSKYVNNIQFEYAYMCVGRGWYEVEDVRDGDTVLSDIDGAKASFYNPFTSPNSGDPLLQIGGDIEEPVQTVRRSNNVDGLTLSAPNQVNLPASANYTFTPAATAGEAGDTILQPTDNITFSSVLEVGKQITLTAGDMNALVRSNDTIVVNDASNTFSSTGLSALFPVGSRIQGSGFTHSANGIVFTVASHSGPNTVVLTGGTVVSESTGSIDVYRVVDYDGTYTIAGFVSDNEIVLTTSTFTNSVSDSASIVVLGDGAEWTSWITLKDDQMTQVWCNMVAPQGMYADAGNGKFAVSVELEIECQALDSDFEPVGAVDSATATVSGGTSNQRGITIEHLLSWSGPTRVRARRVNDFQYSFPGALVDEVKWADLFSVSPVASPDFGNVTTCQVVTKATSGALSVKDRKLNCRATRRIPTYNGTIFSGEFTPDGSIASGTISGSRAFVDILAAVAKDITIGRRDIATDIDMAQIWSVYQDVAAWNPLCAEFSYTLDSDNISFEETVGMIANACFCQAYRQNGKIRFMFDHAQPVSTALFTHRNKKPASDTISRKFKSDSDYDGVELVYSDAVSDQSETIKLPLDGMATKYQKVEVAGLRNYEQAWYRANREYNRIRLQRLAIETDVTADGRLLLPGTRIDIADNTRFEANDGEVVGQDGLQLTLSRHVVFGAGDHSIVLIQRDGSLESIACTAGGSGNKVILAHAPAEAINVTGGEEGIRTIFSFAEDTGRDALAWLVQEVDIQDDKYVRVKGINYSAGYYAADTEDIPGRETVIQ